MTRPPVEPAADIRGLAHVVRQLYVALCEQGFSEAQALHLTTTWLATMTARPPQRGGDQ